MCGAEKYICQKCGADICSKDLPPTWMEPVPGKQHNGNVCPMCMCVFNSLKEDKRKKISLAAPTKVQRMAVVRNNDYGFLVPAFPVYGLTLPLVLQLSRLLLFGAERR
jgi:hypothetical protein